MAETRTMAIVAWCNMKIAAWPRLYRSSGGEGMMLRLVSGFDSRCGARSVSRQLVGERCLAVGGGDRRAIGCRLPIRDNGPLKETDT